MNKTPDEIVGSLVSLLNEKQQQVLKDTINKGAWGDSDYDFLDESGKQGTYPMYGYCTNDAKNAGHFSGRQISAMFRSIYGKMCDKNGIGQYMSHCSDWWDDGSGDMLFIRWDIYKAFENWANH